MVSNIFFFFLSVGAHFASLFSQGGYVRLVANVSWSSSGLQDRPDPAGRGVRQVGSSGGHNG